jgi:hypothetical protein
MPQPETSTFRRQHAIQAYEIDSDDIYIPMDPPINPDQLINNNEEEIEPLTSRLKQCKFELTYV